MPDLFTLDLRLTAAHIVLTLGSLILLWLVQRILSKIIVPRLRRMIKHTGTDVDDIILNALRLPYRLIIMALALYVGTLFLLSGVPDFVMNIVRTLVILAAFAALYRLIGVLMRSTYLLQKLTGIALDENLLPFMRTALRVTVIVLAALVILQEWDYDIGALIAGLGVGGLMLALAAEDTVSNLFGFTTIVGDRPLVVGEFIITPDVKGTVEKVGIRSTRIRQLDQALVTIPNSTLAGSVITNWSRLEKRRLDMTIGITYDASSNQIRTLLERLEALLKAWDGIDPDSVTVLFTEFGGSSLDVRMIAYIKQADWKLFMITRQAIMLAVMEIVEELGLGFAFPSQSVYIEQMPGGVDPLLLGEAEHPADDND